MKFSVVTISFNQAQFLERTIRSVLAQDGVEVEYIVVDPCSTDGSRDIIERYRDRIAHVIFEKDEGPADGLNKGFARASGDVYCYLNSDDEFCRGTLAQVDRYFSNNPDVDVVCGHAHVIDAEGRRLRRVFSDPYHRLRQAYGATIQIQPSTYFRAAAFKRISGFNVANKISWDGELIVDLALSGARIEVIDAFLSLYRLHTRSITGSGNRDHMRKAEFDRRFKKLMGREWRPADIYIEQLWRVIRHASNPKAFLERLLRGPIYRRFEDK